MSRWNESDPTCTRVDGACVDLVIQSRAKDLGGLPVRRALPSALRRLVGPFIFFDHMGPVRFPRGEGFDVRPHPHIALATITYLFDGEILHRDSVGATQVIRPGDVNWMVAGHGIVHSERSPREGREGGAALHGIQMWVALPREHEETAPRFEHHPRTAVPEVRRPGAVLRVVAGTAYGQRAPTAVLSPTLLVHATLDDGASIDVDREHEERAFYVVEGSVATDGRTFTEGDMVVLRPGADVAIRASSPSNVVLVGGAPIDGPRHIWWNFVASTKDRIEQAKADWAAGRFPSVPGDDEERIPLPES